MSMSIAGPAGLINSVILSRSAAQAKNLSLAVITIKSERFFARLRLTQNDIMGSMLKIIQH